MTSAAFTVNGAANPAAHSVTYGSTVTLQLVDYSGANSISWEILSTSHSEDPKPTITPSGVPLGSTATFVFRSDPGGGAGRGVLVRCTVIDSTKTVYTQSAIVGVPATISSIIPLVPGEIQERSLTHGWGATVNTLIATGGGGGGGGLASTTINDSSVSGTSVKDALNTLLALTPNAAGAYANQPVVWNGTAYAPSSGTLELHSTAGNARLSGSTGSLVMKGSSGQLTLGSSIQFSNHNTGFFGATPIARPAPNSYANLLVGLKNLGLFDSTSTAPISGSDLTAGTITNTEISGSAGIAGGKLANATITATQIAAATITNTEISASAGILPSKLATQLTKTVLMNPTGSTAVPQACALGPGLDAVTSLLQLKVPGNEGDMLVYSQSAWRFMGAKQVVLGDANATLSVTNNSAHVFIVPSGTFTTSRTFTLGSGGAETGDIFYFFIYDTSGLTNTLTFLGNTSEVIIGSGAPSGNPTNGLRVLAGAGVPVMRAFQWNGAVMLNVANRLLNARGTA